MASFKLKLELRHDLYYKKYKYRITVNELGLWYSKNCNTIDQFKNKVGSVNANSYLLYTRKRFDSFSDEDYDRVEKIIDFRNKFLANKSGSIRQEGSTISFYTNDDLVLLELDSISKSKIKVYEADLMPQGVKYMRNPEHGYRVYFKNKMIDNEIREEFASYFNRTADVHPSKSFEQWANFLSRGARRSYLSENFFIEYDDPKTLMMIHLMFPGLARVNYKLEKKSK